MGDGIASCMNLRFAPGLCNSLKLSMAQMLSEMGLHPGNGGAFGVGSGNGYSVPRSMMQNVGLYGQIRGGPEAESGGGMGDGPVAGAGRGFDADAQRDPTLSTGVATTKARGSGDPSIRSPYRKRVGQYFQRLSEELDKGQ